MPDLNIGVIARNVSISGASVEEVEQMILKLGLDSSGVTTVDVKNGAGDPPPAAEKPKATRTRRPKKAEAEEPAEEKPKATRTRRSKKAEVEEPAEEEAPKRAAATKGRKASDDLEEEAPKRSARAAKKEEPEPAPKADDDGEDGPNDDELIELFQGKKYKRLTHIIAYLMDDLGWSEEEDVKGFCLDNANEIPALANQRGLEARIGAMIEARD